MKYLIGALVIIVALVGYFINASNNADKERLAKVKAEQMQRLAQNKADELNAEKRLNQQKHEFENAKKLKAEQELVASQKRVKELEQAQKEEPNNQVSEKKESKYTEEEWLAICKSTAKTAKAIMTKRQEGVPMSEMMDKVVTTADNNIKKMLRTIVVSAYSEHAYGSEDVQSKTITEFENRTYVNCLKAEDK